MRAIRRRLLMSADAENGLTLIEVVVAMMVFMIISVSVLYTMVSLLSVTRESRNRQVATNLAAQEIDLARDISDIFNLVYDDTDYQLNGETFHVSRTAKWVYSSGDVAPCGAGTGSLRFKFVEVVVTWDGGDGAEVRSNTYINPNERINDPTLGTIIAAVTTATGEGVQNVTVTATPSAGAALTEKTDSEGCAFFLGVTPGTFTVKLTSPTGTTYVDINGVTQPTQSVTVVAASSASAPFTYDEAGTFQATYTTSTLLVPTNLSTSLLSTRDTSVSTATTASNPRSFYVSPWPDGYSVVAGHVPTCHASDPGLWTAVTGKQAGVRPDPVAVASAGTTAVTVPTGTLTVTDMSASGSTNRYLVAVSQNVTTSGQPGCATTQILRWAQTSTTTMVVALPYGTWDIYKGSSTTFVPPGSGTRITTGMSVGAGGSISAGVVTFDPREAEVTG